MHIQFDINHPCDSGSFPTAPSLDCATPHLEASLAVLERCGQVAGRDFGPPTEVLPPLAVFCYCGPHSA